MLALFFLTALFLLATAFQKLLPVELNAALSNELHTRASLVADAGVEDTIAFIESALAQGNEPFAGSPPYLRSGGLGADWTWTATVTPDALTPPNSNGSIRVYRIDSIASFGKRQLRRISAYAGQQSFARFALYADTVDQTGWWDPSTEHYDGPFHVNDPLRIGTPGGVYSNAYSPLFLSTVTSASRDSSSADGVTYVSDGGSGAGDPPYDSNGNPIPGRYEALYAQGRPSLRTGVSRIDMPANTQSLASAAWGDPSTGPPSTTGVYVNQAKTGNGSSGGVYIVGDVSKMTMSVDSAGNRSLTIKQAIGQTTVTETLASSVRAPDGQNVPQGRTLVVPPFGKPNVVSTLTNGVVYSTGTIASLSGVNKGQRTIATDVTKQTEIKIGGSITRSDTPVGQNPTGTADNLGLVTYTLRFPTSLPRSSATPVYLYATAMAGIKGGGGGSVIDGLDKQGLGVLNIYGGLIVSNDGVTVNNANLWNPYTHGFIRTIHYDTNLASSPPPYFPTYPKLTVRSWSDEAI
ncbi:MAG: hypothetical protein EB084_22605 [Proteobacteria bacterium]|nr:hypothetical protein [Pseudomonadota bacterium]